MKEFLILFGLYIFLGTIFTYVLCVTMGKHKKYIENLSEKPREKDDEPED